MKSVAPLTYNTIDAAVVELSHHAGISVTLNDRDGKVLYENKNYVFRETVPVDLRFADVSR